MAISCAESGQQLSNLRALKRLFRRPFTPQHILAKISGRILNRRRDQLAPFERFLRITQTEGA